MRRASVLAGAVLVVLAGALPALAGSVTSDSQCVADEISGVSYGADGAQLDARNVSSATSSDPFRVDLEGDVSWNAASTTPIREHTWEIGLVIGGIRQALYSGGDPNTGGSQVSTGRITIADEVDASADSLASWALENLVGKYEVWGKVDGEGGKCEGSAWVLIEGSPLGGLIGQVSLATSAVGAAMLAGAAVKKKV